MNNTRRRYNGLFPLLLLPFLSHFVAAQETVVSFRNIPYVRDGGERQQLDLFLPLGYETAEKPFPLLVSIHGGGWGGGSKGDALGLARRMIPHGIAVAAVNYRLLPDHKMPAQIVDCKSALRWLRAHAEKYRFDKDRFAVTGHSAGGHLCAALGTLGETREFDRGEHLDESSAVQAVIDLCGPSDLGTYIKGGTAHFFGVERDDALAKDLLKKMSPAQMVTKSTAPMMILHAPDDTLVLVDQSEKLYDVLKKQGIPVELIVMAAATGGHGSDEFGVEKTQRRILAFLQKHLGPSETTKEVKKILENRDEQRIRNKNHWGITPNPNLPNVLILGDSVAIGYLIPVRKALKEKANVYFPLNEDNGPEDCRYARYSLANLDDYLGKTKWDVIRFNWGHHDLMRHKDGRADLEGRPRYSIEEYEQYLDRMVAELKKTGAKLLWASSTKIPPGVVGLREGDEVAYNAVAEKVMKKHGIPIDDLYEATKSFGPDRFLMPGHTRLSSEENEKITPRIVDGISRMLSDSDTPGP